MEAQSNIAEVKGAKSKIEVGIMKMIAKLQKQLQRTFKVIGYSKVVLAMFAILFAVSNTAAAAFDFKGIEVGGQYSSAEKVQAAFVINLPGHTGFPPMECENLKDGGKSCGGFTSIGGALAQAGVVISPEGVVTRIAMTIDSRDFQNVLSVAIEKYGKPTETTNEVEQNRMGAKFQNTTYLWQEKEGNYLRISKYNKTLERGDVYFGTAEDTALQRQIYGPKKGDI